jgi:hypothetical protein
MAALGRIVSAAIVVVHLMAGCCAHHAHACDCEGQQPTKVGAHCTDMQHHDCCGGVADHPHHSQHACKGGTCSVVLPSRPAGTSLEKALHAVVVVLPNDLSSVLGSESERHALPTGRLLLPVRLHLANQVLLI